MEMVWCMVMFERILIGIPMECIPNMAIERAEEMSEVVGSEILATYIIEENVFNEVTKQGLYVLSEEGKEDFINTMRTGVTPEKKVLDPQYMPWPITNLMSDDELSALWLYLESLPPVEADS